MNHTTILLIAIIASLGCSCSASDRKSPSGHEDGNEALSEMLPKGTLLEDAKRIMLAQGFDWDLKTTILKEDGTRNPSNPFAICTKPNSDSVMIAFSSENTVAVVNIHKKPGATRIDQAVYSAIHTFEKADGRYPKTTEELKTFILKNDDNIEETNLEFLTLKITPDGRCIITPDETHKKYIFPALK